MKIKYLSSASVLIQDEDSSLLTDPWFVDGEFYGSWCNYPPCTVKFDELEKIDGIYISHIHPDHFSVKTLKKMNKNIPIFIHKFHADFLKKAIELLGFSVVEVEHDKRVNFKGICQKIKAANHSRCGRSPAAPLRPCGSG